MILYARARTYYIYASTCTKILSHAHNKTLHPHTILYTKIILHKHLHKLPSNDHHATLHLYTIIYMILFTRCPFTRTRKKLSQHRKPNQATSQFPNTCQVGTHYLALHGAKGVLPTLSHQDVLLLSQIVQILHC